MSKEIYLRQYSSAIVELFEDLLDKHDVTIPSEEDDQKEADNVARLYGMVYAELEDAITGILSEFGEEIKGAPVVKLVDAYANSVSYEEPLISGSLDERISRIQLAKELHEYFLEVRQPSMFELGFDGMVQPDEEDSLCVITKNVLLGNVSGYMVVLYLHRHEAINVSVGPTDYEAIAVATDLMERLLPLKSPCMRNIKLCAGMSGEYVVVSTNASDECIELQLKRNNFLLERGIAVEDEFDTIKISGASVVVLGDQNSATDFEIDATFDMYNY